MRAPAGLLLCPSPAPRDWRGCALCHNLGYNRGNETAAEGPEGNGSDLKEASMTRGQLVSRRSKQSQRSWPSCHLRIESA